MIHEAFPTLTETALGSHPRCVVSVPYGLVAPFHGNVLAAALTFAHDSLFPNVPECAFSRPVRHRPCPTFNKIETFSALITQSSVVQIHPPATTQIDRMQSKATNRNRFAEYKGFPLKQMTWTVCVFVRTRCTPGLFSINRGESGQCASE